MSRLTTAHAIWLWPTLVGGGLPPFTKQLSDLLWAQAQAEAKLDTQQRVCGWGNWGDSGQLNQWDHGFSPCWPSTMNVAASWDVELMGRWSLEMAREFGKANRNQLGPGINLARFAWNGRLGEYMSGEDPFLGARMIESQVSAFRLLDRPAIQVVKHFIPNTIETDRAGMTEVVDERTLFEVYYPPFEAAINAGVSAVMCSYNVVNCTTGLCNAGAAYACANDDILNKHLKEVLGFRGIVISDWDATKCQDEAASTGGCATGAYVDNDYAASAGLDLEMPSCASFKDGVRQRAEEKAARLRWAYLVQGRCVSDSRRLLSGSLRTPRQLQDAAPAPGTPAPAADWLSGVYKDNPFGSALPNAPAPAEITPPTVRLHGKKVQVCPHVGGDNYKSPCKLDLADRIIAESTVVLKNKGLVLPLSKTDGVALVGTQACAVDALAQSGGSGWNGFACNEVPKVNVRDGIAGLADGPALSCPDVTGDNPDAANADTVVAVVSAAKSMEGSDRATLQLEAEDVALIRKYSKAGKKVVVAMNAPGPMITSPWDSGVTAIIVSWLPGQQNGRGIAMALYNETYSASGRLPFTFPKCRTEECTLQDELASVALGDRIDSKSDRVYSEKALIGYRWYHAQGLPVSYPFGFGLFAYGSAGVRYSDAEAMPAKGGMSVTCELQQHGPAVGHEVPQLYLSFPDNIPGEANSKPEWVLKGFKKLPLAAGRPTRVSFHLSVRDLSYWDDAPGRSLWVCAHGRFRVCIGPNARDAIADGVGACTTFASPCGSHGARAAEGPPFVIKDAEEEELQSETELRPGAPIFSGIGLISVLLVALAGVLHCRSRSRLSHMEAVSTTEH